MDPKPTHVIITHPSANQEQLFRADSGLLIGMRVGNMVQIGETIQDAKKRLFMNDERAQRWLREAAGEDWRSEQQRTGSNTQFSIEERDGEPRVITPNGSTASPLAN